MSRTVGWASRRAARSFSAEWPTSTVDRSMTSSSVACTCSGWEAEEEEEEEEDEEEKGE